MRKKAKDNFSLKKFLFLIILFFLFLAMIYSLVSANIRIKRKRVEIILRTENIKKELEASKKLTEMLESEIFGIEDDEYLELVARERLGLKLPGEEVVYITREKEDKEEEMEEEIEEKKQSIIERFWNIFR